MTDLPGWLQEIRDRADKARGPWWVTTTRDERGRSMYEVTTAPWKHAPNVFPLSQASMENLVSHPDVPRLIALVGEMAEVLEACMPDECYGGLAERLEDCGECELQDGCERHEALRALGMYYGEASSDDRD
ncbi:MAG: hypothetical protein VB144_11665 [Clostridia bacterium]|nr:hypothetical protein [Clostridia bacterium]